MHTYLLEPQTPLVFRGGKPFGAASREPARHPWPSSLAGALRTAWMRQASCAPEQTREHAVHGPFLFTTSMQGHQWEWLVPAPADALWLRSEDGHHIELLRLQPGRFSDGSAADLPHDLAPVVLPAHAPPGKPQPVSPFWPVAALQSWDDGAQPSAHDIAAPASLFGQIDTRTHIAIDRSTLAADEGRLFQTQALDFSPARTDTGYASRRWALGVQTPLDLHAQTLTLGGERGLAWLSPAVGDLLAPPAPLMQNLGHAHRIALTLITPAPLQRGLLPGWIGADNIGLPPNVPGLRLRLRAVASKRWEAISGWDLLNWQPRPMRKAAPAGTTYWFDIIDRPDHSAWPQQLWLQSICDSPQDRRDGWGIALPRAGTAIPTTI